MLEHILLSNIRQELEDGQQVIQQQLFCRSFGSSKCARHNDLMRTKLMEALTERINDIKANENE